MEDKSWCLPLTFKLTVVWAFLHTCRRVNRINKYSKWKLFWHSICSLILWQLGKWGGMEALLVHMTTQDQLRLGIRWQHHMYVKNCTTSQSEFLWEMENISGWNNHHVSHPSESVFNISSQTHFTRPLQHAHIWLQENLGNTARWENMWHREKDMDFVTAGCLCLFFHGISEMVNKIINWNNWDYRKAQCFVHQNY